MTKIIHGLEIRAHLRHPMFRAIEIYIAVIDKERNRKSIITNVEITDITDSAAEPAPSLILENNAAQILMDDLWNCGIRPTEGTGSAGSFSAVQNHLKDMKQIAFGLLDKLVLKKEETK